MSPAFVPSTAPPTHFGRFRPSGNLGIYDLRGVRFLPQVLGSGRVIVEAAFGADINGDSSAWTWIEITDDVMYDPGITIVQGRGDDTSVAQAASCTFNLLNQTAAYSAYNPAGVHYPFVRRSTPIRVSVDPGSGPVVLFQGEAAGWPPAWDTSAKVSIVKVTAGGILRRLSQGKTPLKSALYRANAAYAPFAYWSMEEGAAATQVTAASPNTPALIQTGAVTTGVTTGPAGTDAVIDFSGQGSLSALIPFTSAAGFQASFIFNHTDAVQIDQAVGLFTSTGARIYLRFYPTLQNWFAWYYSPTNAGTASSASADSGWMDGDYHLLTASFQQVGADIQFRFARDDGSSHLGQTWSGETLGYLTRIIVNPADFDTTIVQSAFTLGHLAINVPAVNPIVTSATIGGAVDGYLGETADARVARLCGEEGIPVSVTGTSATTMGAQTKQTLVTLLRECETSDGGVLYDGFSAGLGYICRSSRYNLQPAITLDVPSGDLAPPFAPADDDQRNRNDMTVNRTGGGSGRYVDKTGPLGTDAIGTYDSSLTVNTDTDTPLAQIAAWNVHLGTVEGLRYPTLSLDFVSRPGKIPDWVNATDISFRADVTNISDEATQHPPDDVALIVEGYTQKITPLDWDLTAGCSRYSPWSVAVYGTSRYDSTTSKLALPAPAGSTTLYVDSGGGALWVTGAVSFDINVGGVRFPVSNIASSTSPQAFTVGAPSNGVVKDIPAQTSVTLWDRSVYAL